MLREKRDDASDTLSVHRPFRPKRQIPRFYLHTTFPWMGFSRLSSLRSFQQFAQGPKRLSISLSTCTSAHLQSWRNANGIRLLSMDNITLCSSIANRRTMLYNKTDNGFMRPFCRSGNSRSMSSYSSPVTCFIAVGSNMGNRYDYIAHGLRFLEELSLHNVRIQQTSFLYETAPMYVTEQLPFLNGMLQVETTLLPLELLQLCKRVEAHVGRDIHNPARNGPRPLDLDIIYYDIHTPPGMDQSWIPSHHTPNPSPRMGGITFDSLELTIPHPKIQERDFVLYPLKDLDPYLIHPRSHLSSTEMLYNLTHTRDPRDHIQNRTPPIQVLPLPRGRFLRFHQPHIMGILNLTPDSFSDGGKYQGSVELALRQAIQLVEDGADIIDIGGESTRPGSQEIPWEVQLHRVIPLIQHLRRVLPDIPISIDTRHSIVAQQAVEAGGDIINDVSGGTWDPHMRTTVARLGVPMIMMHMRGTPETMQQMTHYHHLVHDVSSELNQLSQSAQKEGIPKWLQVLDPGIGFAKTMEQNLCLIQQFREMNRCIGSSFPIVFGPSRKGFIGKVTGESKPEERDFGTIACCLIGTQNLQGNPVIVRVHNVRAMKHAYRIMEAIENASM